MSTSASTRRITLEPFTMEPSPITLEESTNLIIYRDSNTIAHHALCTCDECQARWDEIVAATPQPALSLAEQLAYDSLYQSEWSDEFPSYI